MINTKLINRRNFLYTLGCVGLATSGYALSNKLGLGSNTKEISQTRILMGTFVSIDLKGEDNALLESAMDKAFATIANAEKIFSRYDNSSPLAILNKQSRIDNAPHELIELINTSIRLTQSTNNAFNPAIVPTLAALKAYNVPSINKLPRSVQKDLAKLTNPQNIKLNKVSIEFLHSDMALSLDGIAKGHIVDLAANELEKIGIYDYMINAGGDIRVNTSPNARPWNIAIQDATNSAKHVQVISLSSGAIATSANYNSLEENGYEHIIGEITQPVLSLSAIAPTCQEADAQATALFAMDSINAANYIQDNSKYSYLMQRPTDIVYSDNWKI